MFGDSDDAWWKTVLGGIFFVGLSVYLYYYFSDFEIAGGTRRIHWIVAWLYNLTGKWITCGVFGLMGAGCLWLGYQEWKDER
jgi:hypothetical protein